MSKVVKCDRCGKIIDNEISIHFSEIVFISNEESKDGCKKYLKRYENWDLCNTCAEYFETWMTVNDNVEKEGQAYKEMKEDNKDGGN